VRIIKKEIVISAVKTLCMTSNATLLEDVCSAYQHASQTETSDLGKSIFAELIENAAIARTQNLPLCQDTGYAVFFVEIGIDVTCDCLLQDAIDEGVRQGYEAGKLRKSVVSDPFRRINTNDNTPAIVHLTQVPGDTLKLSFLAKGGGAENMSQLRCFRPTAEISEIRAFVTDVVQSAGANACPPLIVGIGIGGTIEQSTIIAKKALLREIGSAHPDPFYADLESDWLSALNETGLGPMGLGGSTTALAVFIETHPCHIASLPVTVNLQCHSTRHGTIVL